MKTLKLHQAFDLIREYKGQVKSVVIENTNLWTYFGNTKNAKDKLQGAGSVKRDYSAWRDFLEDEGIDIKPVRPDKKRNELAQHVHIFKGITG